MAKGNNSKDKERPRRKSKLDLADETKKGIIAVLVFVLALLAILSIFSGANTPHNFLYYFFKIGVAIFGSAGYFLLPIALILLGVAMLLSLHEDIYGTPFIGIGIFLIALLGIFQLVLTGHLGIDGNGGGYIGFAIVWPMLRAVGIYASYIILLALVLISILITFNISLIGLIKGLLGKKEKEAQIPEAQLSEKEESALGSMIKKVLPAPSFKVKSLEEEEKEKIAKTGPKKPDFDLILASKMTLKDYKLPPLDLLEADSGEPTSGDIKANANIIKRTLQHFAIEVEMAEVNIGPTVTQYTLRPAQGVKLSKITALQNDLSLALAAHPIRIEAPIPGRSLIGIEIPNKAVTKVRLRNLLEQPEFNHDHKMLTLALGRDVAGTPVFADLERMPHLLIAGATGTGKTICLNTLIISLLFRHAPNFLKFILIDPKTS